MKERLIILFLMVPLLLASSLACAKAPLKLEDVKSGKATLAEYLEYLAENTQAVKEAKEGGLLKGILYNPSEENLGLLLSELFREKAPDQDLEKLLAGNLDSFWETKDDGKTTFLVLPSTITLAGKSCPIYLIGFPRILDNVQTEGDLENMLLHELQHVRDLYQGVQLAGHLIDWQELEEKRVTTGFWKHWLELRAYHLELINIFQAQWEEKADKYSNGYVIKVALNYTEHYEALEKGGSTPLEQSLSAAQIGKYQDVIPTRLGEDIRLDFNIKGRKAFILLKAEEQGKEGW